MKRIIDTLKRTGWYSTVVAILSIALVVGVAKAYTIVQHQISGTGTITVTTTIPTTYNFSTNTNTVDFSGNVLTGNIYTKTMYVNVTNTGTTGNDGGDATITSINATATSGLPEGWTISGQWAGLLPVGQTVSFGITISSVTPIQVAQDTQIPINTTITLSAS